MQHYCATNNNKTQTRYNHLWLKKQKIKKCWPSKWQIYFVFVKMPVDQLVSQLEVYLYKKNSLEEAIFITEKKKTD